MRRNVIAGLALVAVSLTLQSAAIAAPRPSEVPFQDKERNLALGRKVVFMPTPTHGPTMRGETDATDLTDGMLVAPDKNLHADPRAVGWREATVVRALVDLGRSRAVGSVALHSQGGGSGTRFALRAPKSIRVLVSDNGCDFAEAGVFVKAEALEQGLIPAETGTLYKWWFVVPVNVRARYVMLSVQVQSMPATMDEIAVLTPDVSAEIKSVEVEGEFRVCPGCGYELGFHVSFFAAGGEGLRVVLICPDCGARYDLGQRL